MSTVIWDGGIGGNGTNLLDPVNWAGDVLPGMSDDAVIGATGTNGPIVVAGAHMFNSISSNRILQLNAGSNITTAATNSFSASVLMAGGKLTGGTWSFSGVGNALNCSSLGGTLDGVTVSGDILLGTISSILTLTGATRFTTARLERSFTELRLAAGYALHDAVVAEGAATGSRSVRFAADRSGTNTIAATGSIRLVAGGDLNLVNSFSALLVNNGLISAEATGCTLTIQTESITNNNTMRVTSAGTLSVSATNWTSPGVIAMTGATLNLGGTFSVGGFNFAGFARTGGTVNLTGTIDNAGSTLTLNGSTGSWNLLGGTISDGSLAFADGSTLIYTTSGGTLKNVTMPGDIVLGTGLVVTVAGTTRFPTARLIGGSSLRLAPGYVLSDLVVAEGAAAGTRTVRFADGMPGTNTIAATGSIRLLAGSGGGLLLQDLSAATLVNDGLIAAEAAGQTLTIQPGTLINNGAIQITAGTLNLGGTITAGSFNVAGFTRTGGTVNLTGTIDNTGSTLTLNGSTGSWNLLGGMINGGSLAFADGSSLIYTTSGGTLNNVTMPGDIVLGTGLVVTVAGTTRFQTARLIGSNAELWLAAGYTLRDAVVAEGATSGTRAVRFAAVVSGANTIAATSSIRLLAGCGGNLNLINRFAAALVNDGLISAAAAGRTLTIQPGTFANNATVQVTAGTLSVLADNWTNPGAIAAIGGTLNLGGAFLTGDFNFAGFTRTGGTVNLTGTLTNSNDTLMLNGATGSWNLAGGTINGGNLAFADGSTLIFTNSGGTLNSVTVSGDISLGNSTLVTLTGETRFATARLIGSSSQLRLAAGFTLRDAVVADGMTTGTRTVMFAADMAGTNTIAATGSIRLLAGCAGNLNLRDSSVSMLVNNGLISAESLFQGTLTIEPVTFANNATVQVTAGTLSVLADNWTNPGAIAAIGGTLNLGGAFSTGGFNFEDFTNINGTVRLTGTLTNLGNTLLLHASTGSWSLAGGTINGGNLAFADGRTLIFTISGGTLSSVTVSGDIVLETNSNVTLAGATRFATARLIGSACGLSLASGYTLRDAVVAEGAATGVRSVSFGMLGTIAAHASIRLLAGSGGSLVVQNNPGATLINNGLISAEAAGATLTIRPAAFANYGTVQVADGTLSISALWNNFGALAVTGGTLDLGGTFLTGDFNFAGFTRTGGTVNLTGTLTNSNDTLMLNGATGSWNLRGGTIDGGALAFAEGSELIYTIAGGTLNNVTVPGDISLGHSISVTLAGETRFATARLIGSSAQLRLATGYTLRDAVVAEGAATDTRLVTISGSCTIAATGSIRLLAGSGGNLDLNGGLSDALVNNGLISAERAERTLRIQMSSFTNNGLVQVTAGTLSMTPAMYSNTGAFQSSNTGRLVFQGSAVFDGMSLLSIGAGSMAELQDDVLGNSARGDVFAGAGTLMFNGSATAANPQRLEVMSSDRGMSVTAFDANFAYGTVQLGGTTRVQLVDLSDNSVGSAAEALYVNSLVVPTGTTLDLNGLVLYARSAQITGSVIGGTINLIQDMGPLEWDGEGGDGRWLNPLNWSRDTLPGPGDLVFLETSNVVVVDGAAAAGHLVISETHLDIVAGSFVVEGNLINNGTLSVRQGAAVSVGYDYQSDENSALDIAIAGIEPGQFGMLHVLGEALLGGSLVVVAANIDESPVGTVSFFTASSISGSFSTVTLPQSPERRTTIRYVPNSIDLRVFAGTDWSADGVIDSQDYFAFIEDFIMFGSADFNADGASDSQDFFDFLNAFFVGGG